MKNPVNKLKQATLDLDLRARNPVVHEHAIDFSVMDIGRLIGDECRVIKCPVCSRHCIGQERHHSWRFVHNALLQSTTKRTKFEPVVYCLMTHEHVKALQKQGAIVRNRLGQILEVL